MSTCNLIYSLKVAAALSLALVGLNEGILQSAESSPNVVIIYGDDVGYADISVNGATQISTPHIDALAAESLNFTDGHCSASTCTPSRFSLLTGVHAFRRGVRIAPPNASSLISTEMMTLPKLFKKAGYQTGIVGKWHLGLGLKGKGPNWNGELKPGPLELGFDSAFLLPTTNDRVPCVYVDGHRVVGLDPSDPIYVGNQLADVSQPGSTQYPTARKHAFYHSIINGIGRIGYMSGGKSALWDDYSMTDVFVQKARDFLADNKEKPFFLFFSSQDIHIPNTPHPRFQGDSQLGSRGDAILELDWAVGAILRELDRHQLSENTIVIFTSDNGPTHHHDSYPSTPQVGRYSPKSGDNHDASGKWRGGKYEIYEGGTRVPLIIHWPKHIEPGTSTALVNQIDFLASFAGMLKVQLEDEEARDSRDTLAAFLGSDTLGLPFMVEEARGLALRMGSWKYIAGSKSANVKGFMPEEDCLYDLADDPGEQSNLQAHHPQRVHHMASLLKAIVMSKGIRTASELSSTFETVAP